VPALHLGDEVLWDSLAILETLADRYPHAQLWPSDPVLRAYARCISAEMHSGFPALRREMPMNCRVRDRHIDLSDHARRDIDRVDFVHADPDMRQWQAAAEAETRVIEDEEQGQP
jgi:glutathione S-transferase